VVSGKLPEYVRTFIALNTPRDLKDAIVRIQRDLVKFPGARVSWSRPEGIHLTLKFLGDIHRDRLSAVISAVERAATNMPPIRIHTTTTGGFPSLANPRVLWIGLDGGSNLDKLRQCVETQLIALDFPTENKAFHPHLTVGRVKDISRDCKLPERFGSLNLPSIEWAAREVKVMMSELKPSGAIYTCLADVLLTAEAHI